MRRAGRGPRALRVLLAASVAGVVTSLLLALRIGLLAGPLVGVGDNGDGYRLFCTAGLRPDVPGQDAAWRGVVVTTFTTGHPPCPAPWSSGAAMLRAAVSGGPTFSLATVGWVYAAATGLGVAVAVGAIACAAPRRALLAALPVLPLVVVPWWSRFDVSTYAEPAGLVGTVWVVLAVVVVAATGPAARGPRVVALFLLAVGGVVAATAKPAFVPVGVAAVLVAVLVVSRAAPGATRRRRRLVRAAGPITAVAIVALVAAPVAGALRVQDEVYAAVNAHNLLFTALAPELGPEVLTAVGLPPAAGAHVGESFYWAGARDVPGWDAAIGARPLAARADARAILLAHPGAFAELIGRGLTATLRPELGYLPSTPRGTAPERDERRTIYPEAGPLTGPQLARLDAIAFGWLPAVVAGAAVLAGAATLRPPWSRRRRGPGRSVAVGLVRSAAATAVLAVGIVALAVLGDGLYELTKHVWLASYVLLVAGLTLVAGAWNAARSPLRRVLGRSPRTTSSDR